MSYSEALHNLMDQYKDCNLLLPAASEAQLNPFYKYHVEVVPVDLTETSGDVFKVGSVRQVDNNGNDVYIDTYALSKPLLNKMAMAAGIQFNPKETYGERVDKYTYRAHAQGAIRKADGTARTESDQKEICLLDEEEKYKIEFAEKASKGIEDWRQANAAAEIFKGHWEDVYDRYGKVKLNNKGYPVKKFVIDEVDRDRYVERSVMVNMALLRKTWAEKAMTGAKMRVIRALLGTKGTYTLAELRKNFAVPSVVFSPDYSDPIVRQAMLQQAAGSVTNMFGITQIAPVQRIDFDTEASTFDAEADIENPAFISDRELDDAEDYQAPEETQYIPEPEPEPVQAAPAPPQPVQRAVNPAPKPQQTAGYTCCGCGKTIGKNVYDYSMRVHKKALCMDCQKKEKGRNRR